LTAFIDPYFDWWQSAAGRYLKTVQEQPFFFRISGLSLERFLEAKKNADRLLEEMWRNVGLPPLEEVIRLHDRINQLESRFARQYWHREREIVPVMEELKLINQGPGRKIRTAAKRGRKRFRRRSASPAG
jgi:hypothetical protein